MVDPALTAVGISAAALIVSVVTMWITLFRRGELRMTQPTTVMFGPDGPNHEGEPKVFLRTMLYSTAKRGQVIEGMFARLSHMELRQNFPIWVIGEERLSRGSGIFVGEQGIVLNHHFLLPPKTQFAFRAGEYRLEIFARLVGAREAGKLWSSVLTITESEAARLGEPNHAIYFDWGPDSNRYIPSVLSKPRRMPPEVIEYFSRLAQRPETGGL